MRYVLVWPLILSLLPIGQSCTEDMLEFNTNQCCKKCPAGYYKLKSCDEHEIVNNPNAKYICKRCVNGSTFTAIPNLLEKCKPCARCYEKSKMMVEKNCVYNSDTVCTCKEGYGNMHVNKPANQPLHCQRCFNSQQRQWKCPTACGQGYYQDSARNCQRCQREDCHRGECQMNCSTTTTTTTSTTTLSNPKPSDPPLVMPVLLVIVVIVLVLVSLWLFARAQVLYANRGRCCWNSEKDLVLSARDPQINEQVYHPPSSLASLTLNICEGSPFNLSQSPAMPERPNHVTPLLSYMQYRGPRLETQSECWPATVLYAIIKEVPLRRWKEFLRLLSVADQQMERVELEAGLVLGSLEKQYQMLRLWSQRPSAVLEDVYSALHYMDLTGCAQMLQENLEKLQQKTRDKVTLPVEVAQTVLSPGLHRTVEVEAAP